MAVVKVEQSVGGARECCEEYLLNDRFFPEKLMNHNSPLYSRCSRYSRTPLSTSSTSTTYYTHTHTHIKPYRGLLRTCCLRSCPQHTCNTSCSTLHLCLFSFANANKKKQTLHLRLQRLAFMSYNNRHQGLWFRVQFASQVAAVGIHVIQHMVLGFSFQFTSQVAAVGIYVMAFG